MRRKRVTQIFPFLIPIRSWQKNWFYQLKLHLDKNRYAKVVGPLFEHEVCSSKTQMINMFSGYDLIYQQNKVDNLKIASKTVDKIMIYPGEVFSFCYLLNHSKKYGKYKEGLILIDGKVVPKKSGGLCQLSNLLYYLFLMSPLTIMERHGHKVKSFPNPDKDSLEGVDATISSGWLDLKVKNNTDHIYQIHISFDEEYMYGCLLSDYEESIKYSIMNTDFKYIKQNGKVYESVSVVKIHHDKLTNEVISSEKLYDEIVEVNYELPKDIKMEKR